VDAASAGAAAGEGMMSAMIDYTGMLMMSL